MRGGQEADFERGEGAVLYDFPRSQEAIATGEGLFILRFLQPPERDRGRSRSTKKDMFNFTSSPTRPGTCQTDRRLHARYPISLDLRFKILNEKEQVVQEGCGRTHDISSGGAVFEADYVLPARGTAIELVMKWPYLLDENVTLALVMRGAIVRRNKDAVAVKADHYQFRTAGALFKKGNFKAVGIAAGATIPALPQGE